MQTITFTFEENGDISAIQLQNKDIDINYAYLHGNNVIDDKFYATANIHEILKKLTKSAAVLKAFSSKKEEKIVPDVPERIPYIKAVSQAYIPVVIDVAKQKKMGTKLPEEIKETKEIKTETVGKKCGRVLKAGPKVGDKCSRGIEKYGMCKYHFQKWKKAHPFMKSPGTY
jgi:hypothetical protein